MEVAATVTSQEPRGWASSRLGLLAPILLPVTLAMAALIGAFGEPFSFWGDKAVEETAVQQALVFDRSLGPHSNWRFFHPGPAMFYLLAPLYGLTREPLALALGALAINTGAAVAAVLTACRWLGTGAVGITVGLVSLHLASWSPSGVWEHWNPALVPLPFLVTMLLCVSAWTGSWTPLLLASIPASFVVQTHVGAMIPLGMAGIVGVLGLALHRASESRSKAQSVSMDPSVTGEGTPWKIPAVVLIALVVMWTPPMVQQVTASPGEGNLARLVTVALDGTGLPEEGTGWPADRARGAVGSNERRPTAAPSRSRRE